VEGKWQIRIVDEPHINETKLYVYRECGTRREFITSLGDEDGNMRLRSVEMGELLKADIKPTMRVGWMGGNELLQAIADGLCEYGIKARQAPVVQNELDATKYHLEDMRKLMFENIAPLVKKCVEE
jgi:hypothetical protein